MWGESTTLGAVAQVVEAGLLGGGEGGQLLVGEHVEGRAAHLAALQPGHQGSLVQDFAARRVHQPEAVG